MQPLKKISCAVHIERAYLSAVNDVASLSRAELTAEKLLEYCIYQYFGYMAPAPIETLIGYTTAGPLNFGYLSDSELESYTNDVLFVTGCIDRLMEILKPCLAPLLEINGVIAKVRVMGRVANVEFSI